MKLRLLLGRAGSGKTWRCMEEMRQQLKAAPLGPALVLITPEYATYQLELALARTPGLGGIARGTVAGFRRLAYRVLQETGGALRPQVDELGKRLLIRRCLQERETELVTFGRPGRRKSLTEDLVGMLRECKSYGLGAGELRQAAEEMESGPLRDKVQDLAVLLEDFAQRIEGRYTDPEDYLTWTAEHIGRSKWLRQGQIWVDGFMWFNPQEIGVLRALLLQGQAVTVTLCLDEPAAGLHQEETSAFHRIWRTRNRLRDLAAELGIDVEEELLGEPQRFQQPLLRHVEQAVLRNPAPPWRGDGTEGLWVVEAANRRTEMEGIAREMIRLAREYGWRWREMAVVLRDGEAYGELAAAVLGEYDIPFFSDQPRLPVHHPLAELLRSALELAEAGWEYEPLFRCLKTDFIDIPRDDIDGLENYVLEFGIRGSRWTQERDWSYVRVLSLTEDAELPVDERQRLETCNALRRRLVEIFEPVRQGVRNAVTVREVCVALYGLLEQLRCAERLTAWADAAEQEGRLTEGREHRQLWDAVIGLLDQLAETSGQEVLPLAEFRELFEEGLAGLRLQLIPPSLDQVAVASLDRSSLGDVKAVFLPGINDGVLPCRARLEGLFSDAERSRLQVTGVEMAPGAADDAYAEQLAVYTALTRASTFLWVSYPLADEEGKGLTPSLTVKRLLAIAGKGVFRTLPLEIEAGKEAEYIVNPRRALQDVAAAVRRAGELAAVPDVWWQVLRWAEERPGWAAQLGQNLRGLFHRNEAKPLPPELARKLYRRREVLRGSVTRFEQFQSCPFRHFAQYGLGIKERAIFRLRAADMGQFLHAVLKEFGEAVRRSGRNWGELTEDEGRELCAKTVLELAPRLQNEILLSSEQHRYLLGRLERIAQRAVKRLCEFSGSSTFRPVALEAGFGGRGAVIPPLAYALEDGTRLEIQGQIDRVDQAEIAGRRCQLVIDYKTGQARLSLFDVRHGLKLQLLTYLLVARQAADVLCGNGTADPAGMVYFFVKEPGVLSEQPLSDAEVEAEQNKQLRFQGWIEAAPAVLQALDGTEAGYSAFMPVQLTKNGEFSKTSLRNVKTAEEFAALLRFAEATLQDTARRILDGEIGIRPYRRADRRTPCGYCPVQAVCQFDATLPGNEYRVLGNESPEELMRHICGGGGADGVVS